MRTMHGTEQVLSVLCVTISTSTIIVVILAIIIIVIAPALSLSVHRKLPGSRGLLVSGLWVLFITCCSRLKSHWIRVARSLTFDAKC